MKKLEKLWFIFIIYSSMGWMFEELWYLLVKNDIVNRGLLYGPYLPIYGIGALIIYFLLWNFMHKKHKIGNINVILVFIAIFFIATITEYLAHYLLDEFFNIKLWNYSKEKLNINGRVCLSASANFALGGTFAMYFIQPIIEKITTKYNDKMLYHIIFFISATIFVVDLLIKIL